MTIMLMNPLSQLQCLAKCCCCFIIIIIRSSHAQTADISISKIIENINDNRYNNNIIHNNYNSNSNNSIIYSYPMASIILQLYQDSMVGIDRVLSRRLKSMDNVSISSIQPLYDKLISDQIAPVFEGLGKRKVVEVKIIDL